ncbi:MAG: phage portal protein [Sphingobium sp.]|nr:MAG: phage portal protein [Sphingobium sp.]
MSFMSRISSFFGGASQRAHAFGGGSRAYDAGSYDSREMGEWNPGINHPDGEINMTRDRIVARARDLDRNNPIISGGVDRRAETVVGARIRPEFQPAFEAMGRTADWADDWATAAENEFHIWAYNSRKICDVERHSQFGGLVETAYRHWWVDGEACAAIYQLDRGGTYQTAVKLIDPDRLSNPDGMADNSLLANGNRVVGGVELDRHGAPVAYHIRVKHPAEMQAGEGAFRWERIVLETKMGRPQFVHAYQRKRAEQRRGVSKLVSSMKKTKMFDRYDNAELEAALLNAINAFFIESAAPTADVAQMFAPTGGDQDRGWNLEKQLDYRRKNRIKVSGTQVIHGLPGEKFSPLKAERPSANYPEFQATGLRSIAAAFGLSYPQLSQNWADINYSSARTLLNEIWRGLLHDRWLFTQAFCTPICSAWLEEAVAIGKVKVPGGALNFYRWRDALCLYEWMGPGRGSIDPKKESEASDLDLAAGRTNLALEAADRGLDRRQVLMGLARDRKLREKFGIAEPVPPQKGAGRPSGDDEDNDARDARERAGEDA